MQFSHSVWSTERWYGQDSPRIFFYPCLFVSIILQRTTTLALAFYQNLKAALQISNYDPFQCELTYHTPLINQIFTKIGFNVLRAPTFLSIILRMLRSLFFPVYISPPKYLPKVKEACSAPRKKFNGIHSSHSGANPPQDPLTKPTN